MPKKNKKKQRQADTRATAPANSKATARADAKPKAPPSYQATRETVESLIIALVLAFLFRTFQAEAFVIPTGSMAPTLMGMHKDVYCDQCGQRFKVNASDEGKAVAELRGNQTYARHPFTSYSAAQLHYEVQTVAGLCQNCRYPMPFQAELPDSIPEAAGDIAHQNASSGDRILVNKYLYSFTEPRRWDVVVFKYPGNASQNYIKRLVGLPNETLRLYQGDVYTSPDGNEFSILRKPADKVLAMRQLVHDTKHDPASLYEAGWPLRWQPANDTTALDVVTKIKGKNVRQMYKLGGGEATDWLRYTHTPAPLQAWRAVRERIGAKQPLDGLLADAPGRDAPRLVTDFNSYNTEVQRFRLTNTRYTPSLTPDPKSEGLHWASDLSLDADLQVETSTGTLLLDLVEAGQHFMCEIDIATGDAKLDVLAFETREPVLSVGTAKTPLRGAGRYKVRFANVDDQLLLWVNGNQVSFKTAGLYDADTAFGSAMGLAPKTSDTDAGDLAPVSIGAHGTKLTINRLQVHRDIYYIADSWRRGRGTPVTDYNLLPQPTRTALGGIEYTATGGGARGPLWRVTRDPALWPIIGNRLEEDFIIGEDQFFVMGDNSPASLDCRLWAGGGSTGRPGGDYLERSLLTGKAVCVYWPHALVSIPTPKRGLRIPVVPNLGDIRLVR